ncbi:MAG TPA: DUF3775 domain-containing protein [Xanthobacteraceae bacterium]|nr:DUF3775 domain-containing protein [Xanthobacteraceae bacterium]
MDETSTLSISSKKVCYIISKARQFEAKDVVADPESGSNPADDRMVDILEDQGDDPVYEELMAFIGALDEDEQVDLIALTWLGRGDASIDEWEELRSEAARARNERTAVYLLGLPLLPEHLEEGLSQFGRSCED